MYYCSPYLRRRRRRHASSSADASSAPHTIIYDTRQSCCCRCCCSCYRGCRRRRRHTTAGRHYQRNDKCASAVRPFAGDNDIIINDIDLSSVPRLTLSFYIFYVLLFIVVVIVVSFPTFYSCRRVPLIIIIIRVISHTQTFRRILISSGV